MSRTYCHTHSAYDCQTCADEILSLGIQVDKDRIKWLESEVARLEACAARTVPVEDVVLPIASAYESGIGHCNDGLCNPYKEGSAEAYAYDYGKEFGKSRATKHSVGDAIPHVAVVGEPIPQDWKGVDGAVAWHLMDRHGEGWAHIGQMMDAWLAANSILAAELATLREKAAMVDELRKDAEIAVTSIYIALDALNEIIEMDGQDNLGDAKREATKAMAQLAAIAQDKGE